jgi:hypothetical protein
MAAQPRMRKSPGRIERETGERACRAISSMATPGTKEQKRA